MAYCGTDVKTTFFWREVIEMVDDMCFFGEPHRASQDCATLFCSVWSWPCTQQIYYDICQGMVGDSFALYTLSTAFLNFAKNIYK